MRSKKNWMKWHKQVISLVMAGAMLLGCDGVMNTKSYAAESGIEEDIPNLKDAVTDEFGDDFIMGTAICGNELSDKKLMAIVTKHFNAVTFGNELKPDSIFNYSNDKCPGTETVTLNGEELVVPVTNFDRPEAMLDKIAEWNEDNPDSVIRVRGHVLTWHSQTPEWFFHEDYDASKPYVDPETMTKRHEWYIKTVLTHFVGEDSKYKDMFYGWDVVNEAVSDSSGSYRTDQENSSWWAVYQNQDFIINAFKFANKYAPASLELYYNDYSDSDVKKSKGIAQLLTDVKAAEGTRIDGFGMQGHYHTTNYPTIDEFKAAAKLYGGIVDKIQLTEMDFQCSADYDGTDATYEAENIRLGHRYKDFYDAIKELRADGVNFTNITVWGVIDKNSWLQHASFVGGGANGNKKQVPLLFGDHYEAKQAYWAFVDETKLKDEIPYPESASTKKVEITIPKGTATIDGELEDVWKQAKEIPLEVKQGAKTDATVRLLWDETNLYAFVSVKDDVLNAGSMNAYEQDSVELFIDEKNDKASSYQADDKQYRINFKNEQSFNGEKCLEQHIKSEVKLTEDGYDIEAAIAWTDVKPAEGNKIGIDVQINDANARMVRSGTLNLYDSTGQGYQNPSVFGTAKLVAGSTEIAEQTVASTEVTEEVEKLSWFDKILRFFKIK